MQTGARNPTYTRRDLLRISGTLAAIATAVRAFPAAPSAYGKEAPAPLHLGMVLPRAAAYPHLGTSILAGMERYFARSAGRAVTFRTIELAPGTGFIESAVERLLAEGPLDFLIGMATPTVAARLHERLAASGIVFVNATVGANVPRDTEHSPQVLHSTLAHWQGSWALGRWAAANLGKRSVLAASLHDSGYDAFYAFRLGFESQGGEILATHVTAQPVRHADVAALLDSPEGRRADCVYAAYSGEQALDFVRAYARAAPATRPPLLGSAFLADEPLLRALGEEALGVRTVATWAAALDTPANRDFCRDYRAQVGQDPDILAVLGFDTAHLIDQAASASRAHVVQAAGLASGLAARGAIGPRGILSLDTNTGIVASPLYLREVRITADGIAHVPIATLAGPRHDDAEIALLRASQKTGWVTPYLCG